MQNQNPSIEDLMNNKGDGNAPRKAVSEMNTQERLQDRIQKISGSQKEEATKATAQKIGVEYIDLTAFPIAPEALRLLPKKQAIALKMVPFLLHGEEIRVAALDPKNEQVKEVAFQIGERNKAHVGIYLCSEASLLRGIKMYETLPKIKSIAKGVQIDEEDLERYEQQINVPEDIAGLIKETDTTQLISVMLAAAVKIGSSDIHVEAEENQIALRYRIDGVLKTIADIDKDRWKQLINRIKLIAGLKINIVSEPQDGRYTIFMGGKKIDVRTSTLPTAFGESVVMRLLVPDAINLEFEKLGFRPAVLKKLEAEVVKPNGMIITTGPTGSGKTTTLYAILNKLNTPDVKIITLEDPIEYKVEGINQSQIDHTKEYTFSDGLRSILRQDPDIVMVGEIRDKETADTAIQAALTGHLLLSTIHTNNAAGAVPRFLSMGVDPALLAPALRVIMGQRLVRRLCENCRKETTLDADTLARVEEIVTAIPANSGESVDLASAKFYAPGGCKACNAGYKGRVGIYEIIIISDPVENAIRGGAVTDQDMLAIAQEQGMTTMEQDGLLKAIDGLTSVEEVFRVAAT